MENGKLINIKPSFNFYYPGMYNLSRDLKKLA